MLVSKQPLSSPEELKLTNLFLSDGFLLLQKVIRANYDAALIEAKTATVDSLVDQGSAVDIAENLRECRRLRMCLDVLEEFAKPDKDRYTIQVDTE